MIVLILIIAFILLVIIVAAILFIRTDEFKMHKAYMNKVNNYPRAGSSRRK